MTKFGVRLSAMAVVVVGAIGLGVLHSTSTEQLPPRPIERSTTLPKPLPTKTPTTRVSSFVPLRWVP